MVSDHGSPPALARHDKIEDCGADLWVFGYGSLMWRPGFESAESLSAVLQGFSRSLCIYSHVYRGSPAAPGLVLGLDPGGSCHGQAFRVARENREQVLDYLREREQVTGVYIERYLPITLVDGRLVNALVYVADTAHNQYAGALSVSDMAARVSNAFGQAGPNRDYVTNTARHLQDMDICDERLEAVIKLLNEQPEL